MAKSRDSKKNRPATMIRMVVARNVVALRDRVYAKERSETARNRKLSKAVGCSLSQVQRICSGAAEGIGTSIDYIEWFASALGVEPKDLVTPYHVKRSSEAPTSDPGKRTDDQALLQRKNG